MRSQLDDIAEGFRVNPSDVQSFSSLLKDDKLCTLYFRAFQGINIPKSDYMRYLGFSFSDYLKEKEMVAISVLPKEKRDPRIKPVLEVVKREMNVYSSKMQGFGVAGLIYGSFYFGDLSDNPDLDLDFIVTKRDDHDSLFGELVDSIDNAVDPNIISKSLHTDVINLEAHEADLNSFLSGSYDSILKDGMGETLVEYSSLILLSKKLYIPYLDNASIKKSLNHMTYKIESIAKNDPVFRALLISSFVGIRNDRSFKNRPVYKRSRRYTPQRKENRKCYKCNSRKFNA